MNTHADSADIVFRNGVIFNPYLCEWNKLDFAVRSGYIIGVGPGYAGKTEVDLHGTHVTPGFIDAHVHIESSLLTPYEYARLVIQHGTTTVIADPHEIANVCGTAGIEYMLGADRDLPLDIRIMLPSCVEASESWECVMTLSADVLRSFIGREGVAGLGEMMNVPGVLGSDPSVMEKLTLTGIRDGHAPTLSGHGLDQYIAAGLQSDHEAVNFEEGKEKLRKGMYLYIREGSTERNLKTLIPLVTPCSSIRCCFCTDDRHADMLVRSGHIDDCIRKAIAEGCEPELAYRMATFSPAERFGLTDRGAISPGKLADFCVIDDIRNCKVKSTYKAGSLISPDVFSSPPSFPHKYLFAARTPKPEQIRIQGSGTARVVRILKGQIVTKTEEIPISGEDIPDIEQDLLKLVVISRYFPDRAGIGIVRGFGMKQGAIASSVSHDSHNVIATGTSDREILKAVDLVISHRGAMAICDGDRKECLPLSLAGLMSELPYEQVCENLDRLHNLASQCGAIEDPFMYLSFLALTVIPEIRVSTRGVFDVPEYSVVPLFR